MKKALSILLALVLVLTSCFVASAETTEETNLIQGTGYDVGTYPWAFGSLRTAVQSGDTAQADNTYTAEELANTIVYNKTGGGYGQWLGIDAGSLLFSYETSNYIVNEQLYLKEGETNYGISFDENLKIVRAVRGFEVGKYYKVSFDLAHRFDTTTIAVPGFEAGVVGQADLLNDITLNGGSFDMTNELTTHSFTFLADSAIVDQDGYAYLMFRSPVTYDAFINNISITEYQPPVKPEGWLVNNSSSQNISGYEGSVEYTLGDGIVIDEKSFPERGETLKLDTNDLRVSLPLAVAPNTNYTLSFSYYADALETVGAGNNANLVGKTVAFIDTGIFIPNHPVFEGISGNRLGLAYTMSYLNIYSSNYHMNTPAGHLWTVDSTGAKTGFADQDGDGVADGDKRTYTPVENFHGIEAGKWYTLSFEFNSREFEDIYFTLAKISDSNMWIDDVTLVKNYDDKYEDPDNWVFNASNSQNIEGYTGAVAYSGTGIAVDTTTFSERGKTLKLDNGAYRLSLPLTTKANTNYRLSFSYYTDAVATDNSISGAPYAISSTGIFIPNHPAFEGVSGNRLGLAYTMSYLNIYSSNYHMNTPAGHLWTVDSTGAKTGFADQDGDGVADGDKRTYTPVENFHGIEAGKWYTLSFEFNSREFEDLTFTLSKIGGANMWLDNITLTVDYNKYFEDSNNWALSLVGSGTNRLNISTDGSDGTYFSGEKGSTYHTTNTDVAYTENGEGTSIKLSYPTHASNIALPEITAGKTYRVKFSYKVVTNANTDMSASQLSGMGIYSPAFMDKAISEGNTDVNFSRGTIGWNVFDRYNGTNGIYRYRDETLLSCSQNANGYVSVKGDYTYNAANTWYTKEFYFTANDYTDLYLVVLPGNSSSVIYLDNFEFEKIEIDNTFAVDGSDTPISMRKATDGGVKQAIRYKFTVENSKKEGVSGYELLEYGAVAASDKWLTEGELPEYDVLTGAGKQTALNKKAVVGVSYKPAEDINVMFDYNNSYTVFTAALYNIGFNGKTTDYYEWGTDYIVRPYAVYYNRDNAHTVVVYGDEASSSVFAVMNAILTSNDTSDVAVADESYVSDMLDSNPEILEEFINAGYEYGNAEVQTVKKK